MDNDWSTATISPPISSELYEQLKSIEPSLYGDMEYFPCLVTLRDGQVIDHVYVVPDQPYYRIWGIWPKDDDGKQKIDVQRVAFISESPSRLPVHIANTLYQAEESGMGYCVFTLEFNDGTNQTYVTGNAIDFVPMPLGQTVSEVSKVFPHEGRESENQLQGLKYYWCLFNGVNK